MGEQAGVGVGVGGGADPPVAVVVERQVQRVEAHPGRAEIEHHPAHRAGERHVFAFRVEHEPVHAAVERTQQFEFDQVGLARPGPGQDHAL